MSKQLFSNFFQTTLATTTTAVATSVTLTDASGMNSPTTGEYETLVLYDGVNYEIVKCTSRTSNIITITRAQEGTTGYAFQAGTIVYSSATAATYSSTVPEVISLAVSDENTNLFVGTAKITFRLPHAFSLSEVRASVTTAPTGADLIVDINEDGTTVLSTKLSIDAGEKTSTTATTPAVISDTTLADDAEITIDIDQIGSTIPGTGLKVYLIGQRG